MTHKLLDIHKKILEYGDNKVTIVFDTFKSKPYFNIKQLCEMLGYSKYRDAIKNNLKSEDVFYLKDVVVNYKLLHKNVQGSTRYTNKAGLYTLIMRSKKDDAKEIFDWIVRSVMPSLEEYGDYKMSEPILLKYNKLNMNMNKN